MPELTLGKNRQCRLIMTYTQTDQTGIATGFRLEVSRKRIPTRVTDMRKPNYNTIKDPSAGTYTASIKRDEWKNSEQVAILNDEIETVKHSTNPALIGMPLEFTEDGKLKDIVYELGWVRGYHPDDEEFRGKPK